ncbi:hypothetical protein TNCV_4407031 [Trichonephila clavipes]|nr:hypothetical protein TNCV_4407031 [Trichonephila clavipes]
MKRHEIGSFREIPSTSETDRSHKNSCQMIPVIRLRFVIRLFVTGYPRSHNSKNYDVHMTNLKFAMLRKETLVLDVRNESSGHIYSRGTWRKS